MWWELGLVVLVLLLVLVLEPKKADFSAASTGLKRTWISIAGKRQMKIRAKLSDDARCLKPLNEREERAGKKIEDEDDSGPSLLHLPLEKPMEFLGQQTGFHAIRHGGEIH